jgi:hypothetical protein
MDDIFFDFAERGRRSLYRRKPLIDDSYYHVFHRRDDGAPIFLDDRDCEMFLDTAKRLLRPDLYMDERGRALRPLPCQVDLLGFCLMRNHFHMPVYAELAVGLTDFMRRLQTAYTKRFNRRHGRSGPMFEERYDAELIEDAIQLKTAIAYTHANPGLAAVSHEWSGHRLYVDRGRARAEPWFAAAEGLRLFGGKANYQDWFGRAVAARARREKGRR